MARRRFQRGSLILRGKKQKKWVAKWREDEIEPSGCVRRVQRREVIGPKEEYPTKKLAQRALDQRLSDVNSLTYRARPTATFREFATKWQNTVLTQHKPSTQNADKSRIRTHLLPVFGAVRLKDITAEMVQSFVAKRKVGPKSVRNLIALMREMWHSAQAWGYVQHDPFFGIALPQRGLMQQRFFSLDEMKRIIEAAKEPYKTYYWILAETGVRAGEIGALPVSNVLLEYGAIRITQSVWHGKIQTVKSIKGNRICEISPQLAEHLRGYLRTWKPNSLRLLFATRNGTPWDTDVIRKRKLYPLLNQLNIGRCGFHAFRHGNETVMDQENVPMAVRQDRLGHSDPRTTMMYSHVASEDGRQFAAKLGSLLVPSRAVMPLGTA
jgi:integrase